MKTRYVIVTFAATALTASFAVLETSASSAHPERVPAVTVTSLQGERLNLHATRGPLLVNFWSTGCAACVTELADLAALHTKFARRGLSVIGVTTRYDPPNDVLTVARDKRIPYSVALDLEGDVMRAFGDVEVLPTSLLIAPDGRILQRIRGAIDLADVSERVRQMLPEPGAIAGLRPAK